MLITANELNVKDTFSKAQLPVARIQPNLISTAESELFGLLLRFRLMLQAENHVLGASDKVVNVTSVLDGMIEKADCSRGANSRLRMKISNSFADFLADKGFIYTTAPERRVYITRKQFIRLPN